MCDEGFSLADRNDGLELAGPRVVTVWLTEWMTGIGTAFLERPRW